ncbi:MAG: hypothetical protein H7837_10605 [Magnetococcus sp. MYC-9]
MSRAGGVCGFSLIEFIIWLVVVSLAVAGILPLVGQVLASLQPVSEGIQGHFLAQAVVEQINAQEAASGFDGIQAGACLQADGSTPWVAAELPFTCHVEVRTAELNLAQHTVGCGSQSYVSGNYKCVIVALHRRVSGEPVARIQALFARPVLH